MLPRHRRLGIPVVEEDLQPYDLSTQFFESAPGEYRPISASDYDFDYGALNVNVVYRWEYRPGSTLYLVWTHGKVRYDERGSRGNKDWQAGWEPGFAFDTEPTNTFLAKLTYWFSI